MPYTDGSLRMNFNVQFIDGPKVGEWKLIEEWTPRFRFLDERDGDLVYHEYEVLPDISNVAAQRTLQAKFQGTVRFMGHLQCLTT